MLIRHILPPLFALALLTTGCQHSSSSGPEQNDRVRLRNFRQTLEAELEAVDHIGDPQELHWAELGHAGVGLSCVDGRADDEILGTPGGDAGELLLLLAAAEAEGEAVATDEVPELIAAWVERFGSFYMHTDTHALAELRDELAADPRFDPVLSELDGDDPEALGEWLRDPPEELREALLAHLVHPDAVGCGHLSSVLRAPADYEVRPALAGAVITGFYERLWSHPEQVRFVVLRGEHHERAVLDVEVQGTDTGSEEIAIPMLQPHGDHDQVFVLQPQAVAGFRDRAVDLLHERHPQLDREQLRGRVHDLGERQLEATLTHLDVHVPTIRVVVDREGTRTLEPLGVR